MNSYLENTYLTVIAAVGLLSVIHLLFCKIRYFRSLSSKCPSIVKIKFVTVKVAGLYLVTITFIYTTLVL